MRALETLKMEASLQSVDDVFVTLRDLERFQINLKKEETELVQKRKQVEDSIDKAKEFLKKYMIENGLAELEGTQVKYTLSKSNPKLIIENEKLIPKDYFVDTIVTTVRKDAIKDELKIGAEIPGCRLEESWALKVAVK